MKEGKVKTIRVEEVGRETLDISRLIQRQTSNTRGIGGNLMPSLKKKEKRKRMKWRSGISQTERRIPDRGWSCIRSQTSEARCGIPKKGSERQRFQSAYCTLDIDSWRLRGPDPLALKLKVKFDSGDLLCSIVQYWKWERNYPSCFNEVQTGFIRFSLLFFNSHLSANGERCPIVHARVN